MNTTSTNQETSTTTTTDRAAVLYICTEQGAHELARERAVEESREFAKARDLNVIETVVEAHGGNYLDPKSREGWQRVRDLAEQGLAQVVVTRWPDMISLQHEQQYPEVVWLKQHGTQVWFSWGPLQMPEGEIK
ncbi:hypothetical protein [Streptomyces sp. NPDC002851]